MNEKHVHKFLDTDTNKTTCVRCGRDAYISFDVDLKDVISEIEWRYDNEQRILRSTVSRMNTEHINTFNEYHKKISDLEAKLKIAVGFINTIVGDNDLWTDEHGIRQRTESYNSIKAKEALAEIEKLK